MAELTQNNNSITTGDFSFSGAVVTAICGKPLGGTGGTIIGQTYNADNIDIELRTGNIFGLTPGFKNSIPSKVTDLTDSSSYATTALLDSVSSELKDTLSDYYTKTQADTIFASASQLNSYLTTAQYETDSATFLTQEDISDLATKNELVTVSGEIESWVTEQGYLKTVPDTYYTKTETSGKDELSAAFDAILEYNVTAAAGIKVTTATDVGVKTFGISMTAEPVVTDTTLSGYNGIAAALDGNISGQWNVGLTQDMLATINGKANKTDLNDYLTTAQYQIDSATFVTSADITGDDKFVMTSAGWAVLDEGQVLTPGSGISIVDDAINAKIGTDLAFDDVTSAIKIDTNGNPNNTATNNRNFVEGSWTVANGYNCHAEGAGTSALGYGVHAQGMWTCFSSSKWGDNTHINTDIYWAIGAGASVEGYCNATTSCPMSGTDGVDYGPIHGGIIKVIGNGYIAHDQQPDPDAHEHTHYPSDALILYRDGSLSAAGKISAAGIELGAEPDLSDYVPYSALNLPIGSNNTATNNAIAIGSNNTANDLGFAVGQSNTALNRSLAFGVNNYANDISLAIGYGNYASGNNNNNQSAVNIAIGYGNSAAEHAAAFINVCTAQNYAFAAGHGNLAIDNSVAFGRDNTANFYSFDFGHTNNVKYYSYAFGRGLHYEGQWANGPQYGAFVIGGWNATTSYATTADAPLFIIGNGSNGNPSDGFVVYRNGNVSAKQFQNADGTESINGTTYNFTGVDNIEILPLAATANTANFPNDNVLRFILES
jgi:hypothetical protein